MANPNTAFRYMTVWSRVDEVEVKDFTGEDGKAAMRAKYPDTKRYRVRMFKRSFGSGFKRRSVFFVGVYCTNES